METLKKQKKSISSKRVSWIINALLFYILKLNIFRNKRVWIYGCWEGMRYDDNSKYFFEYMTKTHKEIRHVWMTSSKEILNNLNEQGYEVYLGSSLKGILIQLKAGLCFITNGMDDIARISFAHGATTIGLWHGAGMKKTFYVSQPKGNNLRQLCKRAKDVIYTDIHMDYMVVISDFYRELYMKTFKLKQKQCLITGFPRNDVFKCKHLPSEVLKLEKANEYRYILYLPTFRSYENSVIEDFISELSGNEEFISFLNVEKIRFVAKLHYACNISNNCVKPPIYIYTSEETANVQMLLAISDCLITDFSSAIVDFSVQRKPVMLYAPDYKEMNEKQGIYEEWEPIYSKYSYKDAGEAIKNLIEMMKTGNDGGLFSAINEMCEAPQLNGTYYCENVYRAVAEKIF